MPQRYACCAAGNRHKRLLCLAASNVVYAAGHCSSAMAYRFHHCCITYILYLLPSFPALTYTTLRFCHPCHPVGFGLVSYPSCSTLLPAFLLPACLSSILLPASAWTWPGWFCLDGSSPYTLPAAYTPAPAAALHLPATAPPYTCAAAPSPQHCMPLLPPPGFCCLLPPLLCLPGQWDTATTPCPCPGGWAASHSQGHRQTRTG